MYYVKASQGGWMDEIVTMWTDTTDTPNHLQRMGMDWSASATDMPYHDTRSFKAVDFATHLGSYRCWAKIIYACPPYSWSGALTNTRATKTQAVQEIKADGDLLYLLESCRHAFGVCFLDNELFVI